MRALIQRVKQARVIVGEELVGSIAEGLLAFVGVACGDTEKDAEYIANKLIKLRIFEDDEGKMNLSVQQMRAAVLMVSQFTLMGDTRGQNRPSFIAAEAPVEANRLFEYSCECLIAAGIPLAKGRFQAHMQVELINDGPVTILIDSKKNF